MTLRLRAALLSGVLIVPMAAQAADKPIFAPPPAWVRPAAVPADRAVLGPAATHAQLHDTQIDLAADGAVTSYDENVLKVQTAEGLALLGTISFSWNPETETMTVHKLHILRGTETIDLLAAGQTFTVLRREANLERAAIDGTLTATLQIGGLQVGDRVDFAFSRRRLDPALKGHRDIILTPHPLTDSVRYQVRWPDGAAIRWHATPDLPAPVEGHAGGLHLLSLDLHALKEPVLPKYAPARFRRALQLDLSDYRDWADVAALMRPLYDKAAVLAPNGPIAAEAARIAAATHDPTARAEAALALVQDKIRYLYVGLNDGGYVPADAETTWTRRFGDCKGKTVLLLGLLRALGIQADPVLVSTTPTGDAIPHYLPTAGVFNHVLLRATIDGRTYWLDGTRLGDKHLADIDTPSFHWGLPLLPTGATLVPIMPAPATRPITLTTLKIDASGGFAAPVPAHAETVIRGDAAIAMGRTLANLSVDARDRALREAWRKLFNFIDAGRVDARFNPENGEETLSLDGAARLDWLDGALELEQMKIGYDVDFTRDAGSDATAPYVVAYPAYQVGRETILLPRGGKGFTLDSAAFDATLAGIHYQRSGKIKNGALTLELVRHSAAPEFDAAHAHDDQDRLRRLARQRLYLHDAAPVAPAAPQP